MPRLILFLITLGALAGLVLAFLVYGLTAAVATGVVLALAGCATKIVIRLAAPARTVLAGPQSEQTPGSAVRTRPQAGEGAGCHGVHDRPYE